MLGASPVQYQVAESGLFVCQVTISQHACKPQDLLSLPDCSAGMLCCLPYMITWKITVMYKLAATGVGVRSKSSKIDGEEYLPSPTLNAHLWQTCYSLLCLLCNLFALPP